MSKNSLRQTKEEEVCHRQNADRYFLHCLQAEKRNDIQVRRKSVFDRKRNRLLGFRLQDNYSHHQPRHTDP